MNQEEIMAVLSHSEAEAKSLREIAQTMGLETSSYASWIKAERGLSSILRKLKRWGFVACVRRQNVNGHSGILPRKRRPDRFSRSDSSGLKASNLFH